MVEMSELEPGMKVRIVDRFTDDCCAVPNMAKLLGKVVTVSPHIGKSYALIEEDDRRWAWNKHCMAEIVEEDEFDTSDVDEMLSQMLCAGR